MDSPDMGLRELKKLMTRETIADAALKLALENGMDNLTIDEIARLAFVSPRTFSNYFASKEEAVVSADAPRWAGFVDAAAQRPADEAPLEALRQAVVGSTKAWSLEQVRSFVRHLELDEQFASLRPYRLAQYDALEADLRAVVADRTSADPDADAYPGLVSAAAVATIRSTIGLWMRSGSAARRLPAMLDEAFAQLASGLTGSNHHRSSRRRGA